MTDRTFRAALCYNGKHHTSTQNNISQYPLWFKGQEIPVCCHKHEKSMATSVPNSDVLCILPRTQLKDLFFLSFHSHRKSS